MSSYYAMLALNKRINLKQLMFFRFNLLPHICFNTEVQKCEFADDYESSGRWYEFVFHASKKLLDSAITAPHIFCFLCCFFFYFLSSPIPNKVNRFQAITKWELAEKQPL